MYDAQGKAIEPKGVCDIAVGESSDVAVYENQAS